jgi:hypothetical protein
MLREEFGLALHRFGGMGCECIGDPGMELLPRTAQQSAVSGVLHQRVLEQILRRGRRSALKDEAGID